LVGIAAELEGLQGDCEPAGVVERLGMDVDELMDLHDRLTRVIAAATDDG
jgi:hypothetical protein